ncbi:MAG TPA: DUF1080 domain-containing protein [bacterium]|nr:DUF1080 domain-containing protein [bacterium]HPN42708.1 DUF1080 domain-containing protein [bacterium]
MLKKTISTFINIVIIITGSALAGTSATGGMLQELLQQIPAANNVQNDLVMQAILDGGEENIVSICKDLAAPDTLKSVNAHYAISGLVHSAAQPGREQQKKMLLSALHKALLTDLPDKHKAFLLAQLQSIAGKESIKPISVLLHHEQLCDPAARALVTIGGAEAGKALHKASKEVWYPQRLAIVQALGELQYEQTASTIMGICDEPNGRAGALHALANMGYAPAEDKIRAAIAEKQAGADLLLLFARNRAKHGDTAKCESICRELLSGTTAEQDRIAALSLLVEINGEKAFADIQKMVASGSVTERVAALRLTNPFKDDKYLQQWNELLKTSTPEVQVDIVTMLGEQGNTGAVPVLREKLQSGPTVVRLAAIPALVKIAGDSSVNDLLTALNVAREKIERDAIHQQLLTLPSQVILPKIATTFSAQSPEAKLVLMDIIKQRNAEEFLPMLFAEMQSEQKVRVAALETLAPFADSDDLGYVSEVYLNSSGAEKRAAKSVLVAIVRDGADARTAADKFVAIYNQAAAPEKADLFGIFKAVGSSRFLKLVQAEISNPELSDAAIRAITDWPDESALEPLLDLAGTTKDTTQQILAIRGAMRLLRETVMGEPRALMYCQKFMPAAARPDEKRLVLAHLATIKSVAALKYALSFTHDADLSRDAVMAALKIATQDKETGAGLSSEQVALACIEAGADKKLLASLATTPVLEASENVPPEGFTALFNGVDLTGWKGLVADPVQRAKMSPEQLAQEQAKADSSMRAHWYVVDGVLCFDGLGESLCTIKDYANFELWVDWKIEKLGDSGLYLRGSPQVQIWDPAQFPVGSGGLYNNQKNPDKPLQLADKPVGQWNRFHVIMRGERVSVWLNDVLVVDNVIMENYWERDQAIYPTGQIELQAHLHPLYFKNIFIRELPDSEPLFNGDLFNGKDLTGWQVVGNTPDTWQVADGILYTNGGGGGWISTLKQYGNFKLDLEFRLPPNGNSGVFIRAPREGDAAYVGMEIQVLDDGGSEYTTLQPWQYTGSIYGVLAPAGRYTKPAGEWQTMQIVCINTLVQVTVNGHEIINADLLNYMHRTDTHPGLRNRKGYIGLQNHSTKIEYRNIKLEELE